MSDNSCVIYTRISSDVTGEELGVKRQEEECRAFADSKGWTVTHVYTDNDLSATNDKVVRPEFERLLEDAPKRIVTWHTDRFVRKTKDLQRVIDVGMEVFALKAGYLDLSTPAGRAVAKTVTAWAEYEGEQKAERQLLSNKQKATRGKPLWSHRPFGYTKSGEIVPQEADVLRECFTRALSGWRMGQIANDLNARGILSTKGRKWTTQTLHNVLKSPRYAGFQVYQGKVIGKGNWEPIIAEDLQNAAMAKLKRLPPMGGRNSSDGLLVGVGYCQSCLDENDRDPTLTGKARVFCTVDRNWRTKNKGVPTDNAPQVYTCQRGHLSLSRDIVEEVVIARLAFDYGSQGDPGNPLPNPLPMTSVPVPTLDVVVQDPGSDSDAPGMVTIASKEDVSRLEVERETIRERIRAFLAASEGLLTPEVLAQSLEPLEGRLASINDELTEIAASRGQHTAFQHSIRGAEYFREWLGSLPLAERRAVVAANHVVTLANRGRGSREPVESAVQVDRMV